VGYAEQSMIRPQHVDKGKLNECSPRNENLNKKTRKNVNMDESWVNFKMNDRTDSTIHKNKPHKKSWKISKGGNFFFWPLCWLSVFDLRILITSLWYLPALLMRFILVNRGVSSVIHFEIYSTFIHVHILTNRTKNCGWTHVFRKD
jgi:hypothetical protein